jgi:hypothetical protein
MARIPLENICHHEAGHAITALELGYKVHFIQIDPSTDSMVDDPEAGSFVRYLAERWKCPVCDTEAVDRTAAESVRDLNSKTCSSCRSEKVRFTRRCLGGMQAEEKFSHPEFATKNGEADIRSIHIAFGFDLIDEDDVIEKGRGFVDQLLEKRRKDIIALGYALMDGYRIHEMNPTRTTPYKFEASQFKSVGINPITSAKRVTISPAW